MIEDELIGWEKHGEFAVIIYVLFGWIYRLGDGRRSLFMTDVLYLILFMRYDRYELRYTYFNYFLMIIFSNIEVLGLYEAKAFNSTD